MSEMKKTTALIILDGWGHREDQDSNAIAHANTPVLDDLDKTCTHTLISGSGLDVGLPPGQMGNSEVGHVNLGAGRVVYQDFTRVTKAIDDGEFFENPVLLEHLDNTIRADKAVHVMGLLSAGGVHSHIDHIFAMIKMAAKRGAKKIYLHGFLDGRDTAPRSAKGPLEQADAVFAELGFGKTATVVGRYYAMDRDARWDRVETAYNLIAKAQGSQTANSAIEALEASYQRDENDEFMQATVIGDAVPIEDGDAVFFMNFRADRAREISRPFVEKDFADFDKGEHIELTKFVTLTQYAESIKAPCAFPPVALTNVMGDWLAQHNKTQLRISETEKYAHVTFFYSGGREDLYEGEERILIPSPKVATYDLQPEMNSAELTDKLVGAIESGKFDAIICNYPNGDMVGHTGNFDAAVKAVEAVDACIARIVEAINKNGGDCLITADHGNAEQMRNESTGQAHTAHTSELVPFIHVGSRKTTARSGGTLSDVAPTMLHLMGMEQPAEMTGKPIVTLD
ncbi:2,3-bisphosphoglycerate-independent phosphoglycerate mutase [Paraglaciecola aquimarina]|uniref:2,3-bisphosphoglycerate-independent phosphoglycerate mutase n=1 Tax=Paraglaciecola aquimarina TaxID=1235557 RepID=A0ABU3T224_9ALTE|nr:2,3-bisphosphoglycerate-independent phosphoglycerate mutase [Paraglaciecola aquimarina]MDU0356258.1 2,3-bisphosphoglycerate-independent phosphoglycerate mutase [Paraglaciecola aquimarina]